MGVNPLSSLFQFLRYTLSGRRRYPKDRVVETITVDVRLDMSGIR